MEFLYARIYKRQFKKPPPDLQQKVMQRLALFLSDEMSPILDNHPLRFEWKGYRSINITGDYRLIFKKESDMLIRLEEIGTHSELYGS